MGLHHWPYYQKQLIDVSLLINQLRGGLYLADIDCALSQDLLKQL